jgi:hypothetical protein
VLDADEESFDLGEHGVPLLASAPPRTRARG